jgi:hypothetical protein
MLDTPTRGRPEQAPIRATGLSCSRRRLLAGFAAVGGAALVALVVLAGTAYALNRLSWPHVEPLGDPEFGINFSCRHAEFLLLEDPATGTEVDRSRPGRDEWCAAKLGDLLGATGAKHVRLSLEWSEVEPREGEFDFRVLDALLAEAGRHEATVLLTVGIKAQRHPEYFIPRWALEGTNLPREAVITDDPLLRARALRMVETVVRHAAASPVIDAWGAENEPLVPSKRANWWSLGRDFVQEEVRIIREVDPRARPVVINQAQSHLFDRFESQWRAAIEDADVVAVSLYPFRNFEVPGWEMVVPIAELGPFVPNYAYQAREAHAAGRDYWITEMQAEPWVDFDIHEVSPENPAPNLDASKFRRNVVYARKSGATRVYLWGSEFWLFQSERHGDDAWLSLAREAIRGEPATRSPR